MKNYFLLFLISLLLILLCACEKPEPAAPVPTTTVEPTTYEVNAYVNPDFDSFKFSSTSREATRLMNYLELLPADEIELKTITVNDVDKTITLAFHVLYSGYAISGIDYLWSDFTFTFKDNNYFKDREVGDYDPSFCTVEGDDILIYSLPCATTIDVEGELRTRNGAVSNAYHVACATFVHMSPSLGNTTNTAYGIDVIVAAHDRLARVAVYNTFYAYYQGGATIWKGDTDFFHIYWQYDGGIPRG